VRPGRQPLRLLALCGGAGMIMAGCSSGPGHGSSAPTTPQTSTSTTSAPGTSNPATSTTAATTTTSGGAGACTGFSITAGQTQGAAGTITGTITLAQTGPHCTITGYPSITLFSPSGTVLPLTLADGLTVHVSAPANAPPAPVALTATGTAQFTYQYSDVPTGSATSCPRSATVSVTPPGSSAATAPIALVMAPCDDGNLRVSPVYSSG
jgi:hypothetical protein